MSKSQDSSALFDSTRGSAVVVAEQFRSAEVELDIDQDWLESILIDGVAYSLPPTITRTLGRDQRFRKASSRLGDEEALWLQCKAAKTFAIDGRMPIVYQFLGGMEVPPASASEATADWPAHSRHTLLLLERKQQEVRERLKGYLGWLATEPAYLDEVAMLREAWRRLPDDQALRLPLRRSPLIFDRIPDTSPAPKAMAKFLAATDEFLMKWSLAALTTWELPEPVGPQFPDPLPLNSRAIEHAVVHIVLPAHYPLQGSDVLLEELRAHQRRLAEDQGIPDPVGQMSHHVAYGQMFEVAFWERILRHRFENLHLKGFVSLLEKAIASHLGISVPQVHKHRKAISMCHRGLRHKVPNLKVKG